MSHKGVAINTFRSFNINAGIPSTPDVKVGFRVLVLCLRHQFVAVDLKMIEGYENLDGLEKEIP